jgi:hypothetical protein
VRLVHSAPSTYSAAGMSWVLPRRLSPSAARPIGCPGARFTSAAPDSAPLGLRHHLGTVHPSRLLDTSKGNRPSFTDAAAPELAEPLYEAFCAALRAEGVPVETGVFGARMSVELANDGPVTIVLEG